MTLVNISLNCILNAKPQNHSKFFLNICYDYIFIRQFEQNTEKF